MTALLLLLALAPQDKNDNVAGLAVIASGIGNDYAPDDLAAFIKTTRARHVVVDWAWITAHWKNSKFDAIDGLAKRLKADGVSVAAMYRPRWFETDDVKVPHQVDEKGAPVAHGREICFSSADARAWGAAWAADILKKCPAFDEIVVYNPRQSCKCADCKAGDPIKLTAAFLREVRDAARKVNPKARLGVVYPPVVEWFEALDDVIDVRRPYLFVRADVDFTADVAAAQKCLAKKGAACLAKITWGPGENVTDARLAEFIALARKNKVPFDFWTYETTWLEGIYNIDGLAKALDFDAAKLKPLVVKLGGKIQDKAPDVEELGDLLDDAKKPKDKRIAAAEALGKIGGKAAIEFLLDNSDDKAAEIRLACVRALASAVADPKVRKRLEAMAARDKSPDVRAAAARALEATGSYLDSLPWADTVEEALARAKKENRLVLAFVFPIDNCQLESGHADAAKVAATYALPAGRTLEQLRESDAGFIKEKAALTAMLADPWSGEFVRRKFVPVKLRLVAEHFVVKGDSMYADPLKKIGTSCREAGAPSIIFAAPDGKAAHVVADMGVFSPRLFLRTARAVLEKNTRFNPPSSPKATLDDLILDGDYDAARRRKDVTAAAKATMLLLEGDLAALDTMSGVDTITLGEMRLRRGRFEDARQALLKSPLQQDPRAAYLLACAEDALGRRAEALKLWKEIPPGPWADRAALRMADKGPALDQWETSDVPGADPLAGSTLVKDPRKDAIKAAVSVLLDLQRADGAWIDPHATGFYTAAVPRTALCVDALMAVRDEVDDPRIARAIERGIKVVDLWSEAPTPQVWDATYALHLQLKLYAAAKGDARADHRKRIDALLALIAKLEHDGGWSYMAPPRLHTFNTAPILILLLEARDLGLKVDPKMIDRAAAFLEKCRVGAAAFHYGTAMEHLTPPEGSSSMRSPLCELALHLAEKRKKTDKLAAAIDLFFGHIDEVRATTKKYENYFDRSVLHDGYHYYFGTWYATRALRLLPKDAARAAAGKLRDKILATQEIDGSFVDAQMQGKAYSTAMALLTLAELRDALR